MPFPLNVTDNCGFTENYQALVGPVDLCFIRIPMQGLSPGPIACLYNGTDIRGNGIGHC